MVDGTWPTPVIISINIASRESSFTNDMEIRHCEPSQCHNYSVLGAVFDLRCPLAIWQVLLPVSFRSSDSTGLIYNHTSWSFILHEDDCKSRNWKISKSFDCN